MTSEPFLYLTLAAGVPHHHRLGQGDLAVVDAHVQGLAGLLAQIDDRADPEGQHLGDLHLLAPQLRADFQRDALEKVV